MSIELGIPMCTADGTATIVLIGKPLTIRTKDPTTPRKIGENCGSLGVFRPATWKN